MNVRQTAIAIVAGVGGDHPGRRANTRRRGTERMPVSSTRSPGEPPRAAGRLAEIAGA